MEFKNLFEKIFKKMFFCKSFGWENQRKKYNKKSLFRFCYLNLNSTTRVLLVAEHNFKILHLCGTTKSQWGPGLLCTQMDFYAPPWYIPLVSIHIKPRYFHQVYQWKLILLASYFSGLPIRAIIRFILKD